MGSGRRDWGRSCGCAPTDLPWAVRYAPGAPAFAAHLSEGWIPAGAASSLPVHPIQLYEAFATAAAFVVLQWLARRPGLPAHALMFGFGAGYGVLRFLTSFLRHGPEASFAGLMSFSQAAALGAAGLSAVLLALSLRNGGEAP